MRQTLDALIVKEIKAAQSGKEASIVLKVNALSDHKLIERLYEAAQAGVKIDLIVRGIYCALLEKKKYKHHAKAISIVDEYLEHARVIIFHNGGKEKIFISSADWMVRNLDHRLEAAVAIVDPEIRQELKDIIAIQLKDNVKARVLDNELSSQYVSQVGKKKVRSQIEMYHYLHEKSIK